MGQPNPVKVALGILRVLRDTRPPSPSGGGEFDPSGLKGPLTTLLAGGLPGLTEVRAEVDSFIRQAERVDPDDLNRNEALAYWINVYNAGAMALTIEAQDMGLATVLRVPGAFGRPLLSVAGESLSLDAIEHAKLRRFGDPRIHGALVCGSLSCPTLKSTPYLGSGIDEDLDQQMRVFLRSGGAVVRGETVSLNRIFSWFGRDFVSPHRMPTFVPARKRTVLRSLEPWLPNGAAEARKIEFQSYDWGLACNIA